jgi:predicted Zn-dependent protease
MNRFSRRQIIVATLCIFLSIPVSGARPGQSPASTPKEEFKFGKADLDLLAQVNLLDKRLEREGLVFLDEGTNAYLQRVGESLLPRDLNLEHVIWRFRALRDPVPNAFALANGSVYVNTGLIALLDNESQLAAILAHEITHVLNRHTYLQNRSNRKKYLAINIIAAVGAWNPVGGVAGAAIDIIAAVSPFVLVTTMFGYSRDLEKEADLKGVDVMMIAEYPPEEMVKALTLLSNDIEGEQLKLFYNDHPQLKERIGYVTTYLGSKANKTTAAWELHRERSAYLANIENVSRHDIQLAIPAKHVTASSSASAGETDAQKSYLRSDVQARYDALLPKIMKNPKDVKKGRFTLGDEVLNLNLAKTTDAIVFIRGQGQKLTKGKSAFSILTLSLNFPYVMLTIGIVDAHTGDVLVFATPLAIADATSQDDKPLRKAIEKSLKKLPTAP